MDKIFKQIGQEINKSRKIRGLTRSELAKEIGVSQALIQQYENGSTKIPLETLYKIHNTLKFSVDDCFNNYKKLQGSNTNNSKYVNSKKLDSIRILMIDDNIVDQIVFKETLEKIKIKSNIKSIQDGAEASNEVNKKDLNYDIIFLDIGLPKRSGIEILRLIKSNNNMLGIPVIIYTSSITREDMNLCHKIGCNGYIIKNLSQKLLAKSLETTLRYWMNNVLK